MFSIPFVHFKPLVHLVYLTLLFLDKVEAAPYLGKNLIFNQSHHCQISAAGESPFPKARYIFFNAEMQSEISPCRHLFEIFQTVLNLFGNKQISNVPLNSL